MSRNRNRPASARPPSSDPLITRDDLTAWLAADLAARSGEPFESVPSHDLDALAVIQIGDGRIVLAMLVRIIAAAYEHGDDERLLDAMLANRAIWSMLDLPGPGGSAEPERRCQVCGCSEFRACPGGCAWVGDQDLCSACDGLPVPPAVILAFGKRR